MNTSVEDARWSAAALMSAFLLCCLVGNRIPVVAAPLGLIIVLSPLGLAARTPRELSALAYAAAGLLAFLVVSSTTASLPITQWASYGFLRRDGKIVIAMLPLFYAAIVKHPAATVLRLAALFISLVTVISALGTIEYVGRAVTDQFALGLHLTRRLDDGFLYFEGLHESHNAAAGLYTVASLMALGEARRRNWQRRWTLAFLICTTAVLLTLSRATTAGLFAALFFVVWRSEDRQVRRYGSYALVLGGLVASVTIAGRFLEVRNYQEVANVVTRLEYWSRAIEYVRRSPLLGIGFSGFNDLASHGFVGVEGVWQVKREPLIATDDAHAHNFVLMVAAETGLLGLLVWGAFFAAAFRVLRTRENGGIPVELQGIAQGVGLSIGALFVASMVDVNLTSPATMMPVYFFLGALAALWVPEPFNASASVESLPAPV